MIRLATDENFNGHILLLAEASREDELQDQVWYLPR